jgi:hypothetical protein
VRVDDVVDNFYLSLARRVAAQDAVSVKRRVFVMRVSDEAGNICVCMSLADGVGTSQVLGGVGGAHQCQHLRRGRLCGVGPGTICPKCPSKCPSTHLNPRFLSQMPRS